jgi:hypothetical protein
VLVLGTAVSAALSVVVAVWRIIDRAADLR